MKKFECWHKTARWIPLILALFLFTLFPVQSAWATIYQIPKDLYEESKVLQKAVAASPNSAEAHFNLAMNYAYTGRVTDGWSELKKVDSLDKSYAEKVIAQYEPKTKEK